LFFLFLTSIQFLNKFCILAPKCTSHLLISFYFQMAIISLWPVERSVLFYSLYSIFSFPCVLHVKARMIFFKCDSRCVIHLLKSSQFISIALWINFKCMWSNTTGIFSFLNAWRCFLSSGVCMHYFPHLDYPSFLFSHGWLLYSC
jgi:hypothetical protein